MAHNSLILIAAMLLILAVPPAGAMQDPSAVYCGAMGYIYSIADTPAGPAGVCVLPDGTAVDSWRFLQGKEGTQYSWCAREGYRQQVVSSYRTCGQFGLDECLVCTLPDGTAREVTQLMNLSFAETTCGDRHCGWPEDALSCPDDCPAGGWDMSCDGIRDGRCDPDCPDGAGDPDCGKVPGTKAVALPCALPLLAVAGAGICRLLGGKRGS